MARPKQYWPLLLVLVPVVVAWFGWLGGGALTIDIGSITDQSVVWNFYDRESNEADDYRWSTREAQISLPASVLPGVVALRGAVAPDGTTVTLSLGGRGTVELPEREGPPEMRRYLLLFPHDSDSLGWTTLQIDAERNSVVGVEQRDIGMLVADVTVEPLERPWSVGALLAETPPVLLFALFGGMALLLLFCLRTVGVGWFLATLLSQATGILLVFVWAWQPLWVQPFVLNMLFILLALAGLFWWLHQIVARQVLTLPWLLVVLVAVSGVIPLYLYLKYGLELWMHPANLPILAMGAALLVSFVPRQVRMPLVGVMGAAIVGYGLATFSGAILKDYATDFTALFRGARSFLNGDPLYNLEHIRTNHLGDTYKYPPFFVFLMGPITGLPYVHAILVWHLFNTLLLLVALGLLWRWSGQPLRSWSTVGLIYVVLAFKPVVDTISSGQADILMLVSLAAALLVLAGDRWGWWGAILAFPAAVKLYTGYLLIHAVALRQWRALAAFAASFTLLALLAVLVFGWPVHQVFLFEVLPNIGGGTAWVENQTINGLLNRLVADRIGLIPDGGGLVTLLTYGSALLLTALTFWRVQRMPADMGFGLWIVTLLIILPIAWMHYQAILVIPLYQLFVRLERQSIALDARSLLLYALAWMLLCYGNQWTFFDRTMYEGPLWTLLLSYKLYGLLLLWGAIAYDPTARTVTPRQVEMRSQLLGSYQSGKPESRSPV